MAVDFPNHCLHRLDSISLSTMGLPESLLPHLYKTLGVEREKDFQISDISQLKPESFQNMQEVGFVRSFMLWARMKYLIETHIQTCDPDINSEGIYIDGALTTKGFEDVPIKEMELSVRSKNVLRREGFVTASQLAAFRREDLFKFENIGEGSVREIESQLILLGIWDSEEKPKKTSGIQLAYIGSMNLSVEELNLTTRTLNGLKRHGILDLATLLATDDHDIRDIRNLGNKSAEEVMTIKERYTSLVMPRGEASDETLESDELASIQARNLIFEDIESYESKLGPIGEVQVNRKSLNHFHYAVASRIHKYIENGSKSILEILGDVRTEISGNDFLLKLEPNLVFTDKFLEALDIYLEFTSTLLPTKEITSSLFNYENQYSDDSVDILEFDEVTLFLLGFENTSTRHFLEQETFFSFLDAIQNTLICSPSSWNALKDIVNFHENFGTFPNLLGLTVASFAHNAKNSDLAIQKFKSYLNFAKPSSAERDFAIIKSRVEGNSLDKIGKEHSLTREGVRQILSKYSTHLNALTDAIHDEKSISRRTELEDSFNELFNTRGAIYKDELSEALNKSFEDAYRILPKKYRKFIIDLTRESTIASRWTREIVLQVLQKAGTYYFPLKISDYDHLLEIGELKGPSVAKIGILFDSWGEACRLAGVEPAPALRHEYVKLWSDVELVSFVVRYLKDENTPGSLDGYRAWRELQMDHVPSEALLRNTFESWSNVKRQALEVIRIENGYEVRS